MQNKEPTALETTMVVNNLETAQWLEQQINSKEPPNKNLKKATQDYKKLMSGENIEANEALKKARQL